MDVKPQLKIDSRWHRASLLSKLAFAWLLPMFFRVLKHGLQLTDIDKCPNSCRSEVAVRHLERNWNAELKKKKPSLARALVKTFGWRYIPAGILYTFQEVVVRLSQPFFLGYIIHFFTVHNKSDDYYLYACLAALGLCSSAALFVVGQHYFTLTNTKYGIDIRVACCALLYKKALKLNNASLHKVGVGHVVNVMSNDVFRFDMFSLFIGYLVAVPIQTVIIFYVLWLYFGLSIVGGLIFIFLYFPFQFLMAKLFSYLRLLTVKLTDKRVGLMNEIISGMRVIKIYTWEKPFGDLVGKARSDEVSLIRKACFLKAINLTTNFAFPKLIVFIFYISHVLSGGTLTAELVFVSMSMVNIMRLTLTYFIPNVIQRGAEVNISCKRIQDLLLLPEHEERKGIVNEGIDDDCDLSENSPLVMEKMCAKWIKESEEMTLDNISLCVEKGDLLAVIGSVASGKSSFLMTILNELQCHSGSISVNGKIAYASQEAWCFHGSVRDNIVFARPFEQDKYDEVVHVCALERDFKLFPYGDSTLVGEKGVSLSGGQKARITLARALYTDADLYLLDDPLSAVDTAVAKHIFEKAIMGYLKHKTKILVTHQIQFIKKANRILLLNAGKCVVLGGYEEVLQSGADLISILAEKEKEGTTNEDLEKSQQKPKLQDSKPDRTPLSETRKAPKIAEESKQVGSIEGSVYWQYLKAGEDVFLITIAALSALVSQGLYHYFDVYLSKWTKQESANIGTSYSIFHFLDKDSNATVFTSNSLVHTSNIEAPEIDRTQKSIVLSILIFVLCGWVYVRALSFFVICAKASVNLHNRIFRSLLRAPIEHFDRNPVGRILNRFTRDMGTVDELLPATAYTVQLRLFTAVGVMVVVSMVQPYLIIPAVGLLVAMFGIRGVYIKTAREIKRYEGITRSPVYDHVSTTLGGLSIIRAFGMQKKFIDHFHIHQDDHSGCSFLFYAASRCLGFVCDIATATYIICVTAVIMVFYKSIEGSDVGLAITSALLLTGTTQFLCRQSAELESQITSVERILEYTHVKPEAELETPKERKPVDKWPNKGEIEFSNVFLHYPNSPNPALTDLNCLIKGGEKIGIVGRTGAGKSSLLAALFRMRESTGTIKIDGVNTQLLGLHDLRKEISIIPQDPVLFKGPVRRNIDPFDENEDDVLWQVLEDVQLKNAVDELSGKLDAEVVEGGANFSVGQRQLICLARAILRRNKILVIDEATANVDQLTDSLIQSTIRNKFADCTVLTIAHRLNTIIDCDRIMVLDAGSIVEFDEPYKLLQNRNGYFTSMVNQTGKVMSAHLFESAKEAFERKNHFIESTQI